MGITGWIHPDRDLRDQRILLGAMAGMTGPAPADTFITRPGRIAGFAVCGMTCGHVDWRSPGRPGRAGSSPPPARACNSFPVIAFTSRV